MENFREVSLKETVPMSVKDWKAEGTSQRSDKKKLSLCMIVKNEEKFLPQCLESVSDLVDEIVLVDTGSTDKTMEIAKQFGAKIFEFPWTGNFAEARNVSLEHATGDWILVLDADEAICNEDKDAIRQLMQHEEMLGFLLRIKNIMEDSDNPEIMEHFYVRMFPCHPDIRYFGPIHEQVMHCIKGASGELVYLPIDRLITMVTILHYGYTGKVFREKNKGDRNKKILENLLSNDKKNGFQHLNLGVMYLIEKQYKEALEELTAAKKLVGPKVSYYPMVLICGANALFSMGRGEEAVTWAKECVSLASELPDSHYSLGNAYEAAERYEEAVESYQRAVECSKSQVTFVMHDPATGNWKSYNQMGVSLLKMNKPHEAVAAFEKALEFKPGSPNLLQNLGQTYLQMEGFEKAEKIFREIKSINFTAGFWSLIGLYKKTKNFDAMLELTEAEVKNDPKNVEIWGNLGYVFSDEEDIPRAKICFKHAVDHFASDVPALNNLGATLFQLNESEEAIPYLQKAVTLDSTHTEAKINLARCYVHLRRYQEAYDVLKDHPLDGVHSQFTAHLLAQAALESIPLQELLQSRANDPIFLSSLGPLLIQKNLHSEAAYVYEKLIGRSPGNSRYWFNLGASYLKLNRLQESMKAFSTAIRLDPQMNEARVGLAAVQVLLNLNQRAQPTSTETLTNPA